MVRKCDLTLPHPLFPVLLCKTPQKNKKNLAEKIRCQKMGDIDPHRVHLVFI